jgi:hypothetical protein
MLGLVFTLVVLAGCAARPREANFAGLVDIGDGRQLFLNWPGRRIADDLHHSRQGQLRRGVERRRARRRPDPVVPDKIIALVDKIRSAP